MRANRRRAISLLAVLALAGAACGSDDAATEDVPTDDLATVSGIVRSPAPQVDGAALPSLSTPGEQVEFRADPGELQVVYFGFTNCPDVCPTTLADLTVAIRKLGAPRSELIDVVMVTVDPDRDLDLLDRYITSFIDDAVAAGTDDEQLLAEVAEPFGVSWDVRVLDDGAVEVDHTGFLYAIDDAGQLALTWQFGASSDDISNDLGLLLDRYDT